MSINTKPKKKKKLIEKKITSKQNQNYGGLFYFFILLLKIHLSGSDFVTHELTWIYDLSKLTLENSSNITSPEKSLGLSVQQNMVGMRITEQHVYYMYFFPSFWYSYILLTLEDHAILSFGISYRHSQHLGIQQRLLKTDGRTEGRTKSVNKPAPSSLLKD